MPEKPQLELDVVRSITSLAELARAENSGTRCPLYKDATQAVPGEGRRRAYLMLVGAQPGDKEASPASCSSALPARSRPRPDGGGIPRTEVFVTNAVKHFKHEMRGTRACTNVPTPTKSSAADQARPERAMVKPAVIVALGATARSLSPGRSRAKLRGDVGIARRRCGLGHHPPSFLWASGRRRQAAGIRAFRRRSALAEDPGKTVGQPGTWLDPERSPRRASNRLSSTLLQ